MAGIKIVDLPALGRDLINTDLLEVSLNGSGSRKITGQEIMNASKLAVGSTPIVSGTVGRLLFQNTGDVLGQSANLFWDNTNVLFALGSIATRILNFRPQDTTGAYGNSCSIRGGNGNGRLDFYSASNITELRDNIIILTSVGGPSVQVGASSISLSVGGSTRLQVAPTTGNVLINTTTDAGFKLDVNGTARVSSLTMPNFSTITSGNNYFSFETFRTIFGTTFNTVANQYAFNFDDGGGSNTITSGTTGRFQLSSRFAPTSGTAVYNSFLLNATINQTGGANGITRGLFIDPTLTAAADFRAIETTRGNVALCTTSGNVGVGTSTPTYGIHQVGAIGTAGIFAQRDFGFTALGQILSRASFVAYTTDGTIGLAIGAGSGTPQIQGFFGATASTSAKLSLNPLGGNVLINTTTDAGYKLDVNGTARVQGAITGTSTLSVVGDIYLQHPSGGGSTAFITDANACYIVQNSSRNVQIGYVGNYTFRLNNSTRTIGVSDNGASPTLDASAVLTLGSSTRGFLPPRMTNAQRAAIASPAVGLIVYCTDSTEGLYVYKSTGWTFMV